MENLDKTPVILQEAQKFTDVARQIKSAIIDGEAEPLDAMIACRIMKKAIEMIEKDEEVSSSVMSSFDRFGDKQVSKYNVVVSKEMTGIQYDYSVCNDREYERLLEEKREIDKKVKEREDFLKGIPESGLDYLDMKTGEVTTLHRPVKTGREQLKYKLPKN